MIYNATLSLTKEFGFNWNPAAPIKSLMQMARVILSQSGKRHKGRAGKGGVQFGRIKRKDALIRFIFGIYTVNLQDR